MEMGERASHRVAASRDIDDTVVCDCARTRALTAIQFGMQSSDGEACKLDFDVIRENVGQVGFPEGVWMRLWITRCYTRPQSLPCSSSLPLHTLQALELLTRSKAGICLVKEINAK